MSGNYPNWNFTFNGVVASEDAPLHLNKPAVYVFDYSSVYPNHVLAFSNTSNYDGKQLSLTEGVPLVGPPVLKLTLTMTTPPLWFFCDIHDARPYTMHGPVLYV